jgi:hypothetical protein
VLVLSCCSDLRLTVPGGKRRLLPSFDSCHPLGGIDWGWGPGLSPIIRLQPGETFSRRSLLRGYALEAGTYAAIAEGTVSLRRESTGGRLSEQTGESAAFVHILDRWCDVTWDKKSLRRGWTQWWKTNGRKVRLFSAADGCPNFPELLPQIR